MSEWLSPQWVGARLGVDPARVTVRDGAVRVADDLPKPTSADGSWTCWRPDRPVDGWVVLVNPGGITVHTPVNLRPGSARELAAAIEAAAVWDEDARGARRVS